MNKSFGSGQKSAFTQFTKPQTSPNVIRVFVTPQKESQIIRRKYSFSTDRESESNNKGTPPEMTAEKIGIN